MNSRLPGFYRLPLEQRRQRIAAELGLDENAARQLSQVLLDETTADHMVENLIGVYGLPLGVGLNFRVNGRDHLVPMCVEEPSVIAAASHAAKLIRKSGGFFAEADDPIMIAQVQLCDVADADAARLAILRNAEELIALANCANRSLSDRGGGARSLTVRVLEPGMLVVHLHVDVRDAMGANVVNTMAEAIAEKLGQLSGGVVGLRILSNLADLRCVSVRAEVAFDDLAINEQSGETMADGIVRASRFAELDPYRAATHNKGIMNGVDAVALATGNDWRSIEAGAHAFAATQAGGGYRPLAIWRRNENTLQGTLRMPMAVGTVGGTLRVHPGARLGLRIADVSSSSELGMLMAAVGLATNFAALRAMLAEGIQRGHMSLHARSVALHAGATADLVERVADEMAAAGDVREERAIEILQRLRSAGTLSSPLASCNDR